MSIESKPSAPVGAPLSVPPDDRARVEMDAAPRPRRFALGRRRSSRSLPIYGALAGLVLLSAVIAPASVNSVSLSAVLPFAAFLGIAALGESLVVLSGGIDLSVPAVVTMVGIALLEVSRGNDSDLVKAVVIALVLATAVGMLNGLLVAKVRLTPLVATLAVGSLVTGATLWYRGGLQAESTVPPALARFGSSKLFGSQYLGYPVVIAVLLLLLMSFLLSRTVLGRRFTLVGANARAAWVAGMPVARMQIGAYASAGFLYGVSGVVLSAFIRNPGDNLGAAFLLSPIVAVVIGGVALGGGSGSFFGVIGGAVFLTQLSQVLKVRGYSSGLQSVLLGLVILAAVVDRGAVRNLVRRRRRPAI